MIEELMLENFKSFKTRQRIEFTKGVNKISGRNASGKTTILEAILFGLFGEVPGVNRRDLVSLYGGNMSVTLKFKSPITGRRATIVRTGSLDKENRFVGKDLRMDVEGEDFSLARETDIDKKVKELLGVGKRTFFNVVYARQKEFVDLLIPEKGRMDAILGLTIPAEITEQLKAVSKSLQIDGHIDEKGALQERLRIVSSRQKEEQQRIDDLGTETSSLENRLAEFAETIHGQEERIRAHEDASKGLDEVDRLRLRLENIKGRRQERERDLAERHSMIGESPGDKLIELEDRKAKAVELENRLKDIVEKQLEVERRTLDGQIAALRHSLDEHMDLKELGATVCPKCGQAIDPKRLEEDLQIYRDELNLKAFKLQDLEKELKVVRQQLDSARAKRLDIETSVKVFVREMEDIDRLRDTVTRLADECRSLEEEAATKEDVIKKRMEERLGRAFNSVEEGRLYLRDAMSREQGELRNLVAESRSLSALLAEKRRLQTMSKEMLEEYQKLQEETTISLGIITEYESKLRAVDRLGHTYSEYEKKTREAVLKQLGWLTFKYFQRLTDQQLYSNSFVNVDDYSLQVVPVGSSRPIPAWRCGGGHESLFALSERLAILRIMGFNHLLILDEPTDAVDSENIPSLLEYISKSASEIGQIVLVTHHGYGEEDKVNTIQVSKTGGESRVTIHT